MYLLGWCAIISAQWVLQVAMMRLRLRSNRASSEVEKGTQCYTCCFLVRKKDGTLRPILYLMLALAHVLSALDPRDWMVSLDLQDFLSM